MFSIAVLKDEWVVIAAKQKPGYANKEVLLMFVYISRSSVCYQTV